MNVFFEKNSIYTKLGTEDTVIDEKIRETFSEMTEGISASDDLKKKIMKEIIKQND